MGPVQSVGPGRLSGLGTPHTPSDSREGPLSSSLRLREAVDFERLIETKYQQGTHSLAALQHQARTCRKVLYVSVSYPPFPHPCPNPPHTCPSRLHLCLFRCGGAVCGDWLLVAFEAIASFVLGLPSIALPPPPPRPSSAHPHPIPSVSSPPAPLSPIFPPPRLSARVDGRHTRRKKRRGRAVVAKAVAIDSTPVTHTSLGDR